MDWSDTADEAAFRGRVRELIETKLPARYRELAESDHRESYYPWAVDRASGDPARERASREWLEAVAAEHWVAPHWPAEYGGGGLSWMEQFLLNAELARANVAAPASNVGLNMLGPTLIVHGTEEQKSRFLPPILTGETVWSQGFSEPGAGSDLASLQTRARRDGDEYVVSGQKIWTSHAHYADWIMLLSRTDPDAPKHRGITFLLVDLRSPGVTINPLINMAWGHEFNEEFFEDVRVPADQMVGEENRGWYVAMTLLDNERSNITGAMSTQRKIDRLVDYVASEQGAGRSRVVRLDALRQQIAQRAVEAAVLSNLSLRIITMQRQGIVPNYEASVSKVFGYEAEQGLNIVATKAFGLYANLWDPEGAHAPMEAGFTHGYIERAASIGGGTLEIQRNVIATRGLGLPRG
jgi:alkylation response protein AidB-like acyl-CoA dehydrogenase